MTSSKSSSTPPVNGNCPHDGTKLEVDIGKAPLDTSKGHKYESCTKCSYFYKTVAE